MRNSTMLHDRFKLQKGLSVCINITAETGPPVLHVLCEGCVDKTNV